MSRACDETKDHAQLYRSGVVNIIIDIFILFSVGVSATGSRLQLEGSYYCGFKFADEALV